MEIQTISTLPPDFKGKNYDSEVITDHAGRFLYGSNRGHDSIALFTIDLAKGTLRFVETVSSQGNFPRNFNLDPYFVRFPPLNFRGMATTPSRVDDASPSLANGKVAFVQSIAPVAAASTPGHVAMKP